MWDAILGWLADRANEAVAAIAGLVPAVPPELADACATVAAAMGWVAPVSWIVPWGALGVAIAIVVAGVVAGLAIVVARIVVSYLTLGGGGT